MRIFRKTVPPLRRLPSGSFTMDCEGRVVISTLPSAFPAALAREIGLQVVTTFREAQAADVPLSELVIHYSSLKATARELRGGAVVFLAPQTTLSAKT